MGIPEKEAAESLHPAIYDAGLEMMELAEERGITHMVAPPWITAPYGYPATSLVTLSVQGDLHSMQYRHGERVSTLPELEITEYTLARPAAHFAEHFADIIETIQASGGHDPDYVASIKVITVSSPDRPNSRIRARFDDPAHQMPPLLQEEPTDLTQDPFWDYLVARGVSIGHQKKLGLDVVDASDLGRLRNLLQGWVADERNNLIGDQEAWAGRATQTTLRRLQVAGRWLLSRRAELVVPGGMASYEEGFYAEKGVKGYAGGPPYREVSIDLQQLRKRAPKLAAALGIGGALQLHYAYPYTVAPDTDEESAAYWQPRLRLSYVAADGPPRARQHIAIVERRSGLLLARASLGRNVIDLEGPRPVEVPGEYLSEAHGQTLATLLETLSKGRIQRTADYLKWLVGHRPQVPDYIPHNILDA
jgi:hypothetical protein